MACGVAVSQAFVDFENAEEAARAVRERDHKVFSEKFGDRYVRLIQVSNRPPSAQFYIGHAASAA